MVTWQGNVPRPRPGRRRSSSMPAGTASGEQDLEASEALRNTGDQLDHVEAELAPGQTGGDQDTIGRRLADQLVVQAILEEGLHGPRHQALEDMLIRYAVPVLRKLVADGRIASRAGRLGRPPGSPGTLPELAEADREELVRDMVADALPVFTRAVFVEQHWTSARQASLKTYFVNACILQFAQLHRKWLEQRRAVRPAWRSIRPAPGTRPTRRLRSRSGTRQTAFSR